MEGITVAEVNYRLIRLAQYEMELRALQRLEPRLHDQVRKSLKEAIGSGKFDEIKGTGGWIKGRARSPSRNIGKSGGFRFIYLLFCVQHDIFLFSVYDHRRKLDLTQDEIKKLKKTANSIKATYTGGTEIS